MSGVDFDALVDEARALARDVQGRVVSLGRAAAQAGGDEVAALREERDWFAHLYAVLGLLVGVVRTCGRE